MPLTALSGMERRQLDAAVAHTERVVGLDPRPELDAVAERLRPEELEHRSADALVGAERGLVFTGGAVFQRVLRPVPDRGGVAEPSDRGQRRHHRVTPARRSHRHAVALECLTDHRQLCIGSSQHGDLVGGDQGRVEGGDRSRDRSRFVEFVEVVVDGDQGAVRTT